MAVAHLGKESFGVRVQPGTCLPDKFAQKFTQTAVVHSSLFAGDFTKYTSTTHMKHESYLRQAAIADRQRLTL
jgi:hypothetical protein